LLTSTFFTAIAPSKIDTELEHNIIKISKKKKLDEDRLRAIVADFRKKIKIMEAEEESSYSRAAQLLGNHIKDVEYVALSFYSKSHGIMTYDINIQKAGIRTWNNRNSVGKIVGAFERGAFSFFIIGQGLPVIFQMLYELFMAILEIVWKAAVALGNVAIKGLEKVTNAIVNLEPRQQLVLALIAGFLLAYDKTRDFIINSTRAVIDAVIYILTWFYNLVKGTLEFLTPMLEISVEATGLLFSDVANAIKAYNELNLI
jgi:predicted nucleic acid-binding protein